MKDPELLQVWRTLRPGERKAFRAYLRQAVTPAEEGLLTRLDRLTAPSTARRSAGDAGREEDPCLHADRNRLLRHLEAFLVARELRESPFEHLEILARVYRQRGLELRYQRTLRKLDRWLGDTPENDERTLLARYRRTRLELDDAAGGEERRLDRLRAGLQALDALYVHQKLRLSAAYFGLWRRSVRPGTALKEEDLPLLSALLEAPDGHRATRSFDLYRQQVLIESRPLDEAALEAFQSAIRRFEGGMTLDERYRLHVHLINAFIRQGNETNDESERCRYRQRFLRHVEAIRASGVLYGLGGHLAPKLYLNVTLALVRESRVDDAERWIAEEAARLHPTRQEYYRTLATAMMHLASGEYESAIAVTRDLPFDHVPDTLHLRLIGLKARAELAWEAEYGSRDSGRAVDRLESELNALYEYVRYHAGDIPGERGKRTKALISVLSRYWHLPLLQRKRPEALLQEIDASPPIKAEWVREYLQRAGRRSAER